MPTEKLYLLDMSELNQRMTTLEDKVNSIDAKLDRVLDSLQGNGIAKGFVNDINERTKTNEDKILRLEANGFSEKERDRILHVITFFEGWRVVIAALIFIAPLLALVIKLLTGDS